MALNASGPISLAGSTAGQSIAVELGQSATGQISLNDAVVRTLAGVASGAITMPTNFWGKSSGPSVGGTSTFFNSTAVIVDCCYDATNGKVVVVFFDPVEGNGKAVLGDVSGNNITFGSPVIFFSGTIYWPISCCFAGSGKVAIAFRTRVSNIYNVEAIIGEVSGGSISFGTKVTVSSNRAGNVVCSPTNYGTKVAFLYTTTGSNYLTYNIGTISGTSLSLGGESSIGGAADYLDCAYDSSAGAIVLAYSNRANSDYGTGCVGVVNSNNTMSFGTAVVFYSGGATPAVRCSYDVNNNKTVIVFSNYGLNKLYSVVGTVGSGSSISFGSPTEVYGKYGTLQGVDCCYAGNGKTAVIFEDYSTGMSYVSVGKVSGASISYSAPVLFTSSNADYLSCCYASSQGKVIASYQLSSPGYGYTTVITP